MKRYWYILLVLMLFGCTDDKRVVVLLDRAEVVMEDYPDSAYQFLCEADSCIAEQSKGTRMRHLLLMAEAENKLCLPLPSDTLFQEVVDYYDSHGTPNQQLKAHYLLGCIYRDRGEAPMSLQCYNDAVEKADTLSANCDYTTLFSVYGQMADIYHSQVMPNEEIEALRQYSKYAQKAGNIYESIRGVEFMAAAYDLQGDTVQVLATEEKARELYLKNGLPQAAASSSVMSTYVYIAKGDYAKARQLMQAFEHESGLFDKNGNICEGREHYYHAKGLYYLGVDQLDSAEYEFKRLIPYGYTFDAYRGLMDVSQRRGNAASMFRYAKLYEASYDTLITNIHAEATRQVEGMYDYTRHQKIAMEKAAESERNRNIIYMIIVTVSIATSLLYHLYKRSKEKKQREMEMLSHRYMDTLTQYERTKEELGMMGQDYSAFRQRKEEELKELQSQLEDYQTRYRNLGQSERLDALKRSPIWEAFLNRLNPKKKTKPVSDREWKELSSQFSQCVPQLYAQMKENNKLNQHEQRVTILTRLGLSTKEISILLGTVPQRVTNARESANHKLFSDTSARTFLQNITQI